MQISVGILDGLRLLTVEKAAANNKQVLKLTLNDKPAEAAAAPSGDFFDQFNSTSDAGSGAKDFMHYLWPYEVGGEYLNTVEKVAEAMSTYERVFNHILKQYMTEDQIKWSIFDGINVDRSNPAAVLMNQQVMDRVWDNQRTQFINMITPHIGANSKELRVKFVRQSKAKHYATLPKFPPFFESMTVPAEQTKLQYSKWEKENGFDSGKPVDDSATAPDAPNAEENKAADALFNNA